MGLDHTVGLSGRTGRWPRPPGGSASRRSSTRAWTPRPRVSAPLLPASELAPRTFPGTSSSALTSVAVFTGTRSNTSVRTRTKAWCSQPGGLDPAARSSPQRQVGYSQAQPRW